MKSQLAMAVAATAVIVAWTVPANAQSNANGQYAWMLPKTVLSVTVNYTLTGCHDQAGVGHPDIKIDVSIVKQPAPDTDIGPDFPGGLVAVPASSLNAFWQDKTITIKTEAGSQILLSVGAQPSSQVATIVGNVLTSAVKLTAIGFGVPAAAQGQGPPPAPTCAAALTLLQKLNEAKDQSTSATLSAADQARYATQATALQKALTITKTVLIDPGLTPLDGGPQSKGQKDFSPPASPTSFAIQNGEVGRITPTYEEMMKAWSLAPDPVTYAALTTHVILDFPHATPRQAVQCSGTKGAPPPADCQRTRVVSPAGTLYREVAYIPVFVVTGPDSSKTDAPYTRIMEPALIPFGQFGIPRTMPLSAKIFHQLQWSYAFNDFGEITDGSYNSKSTGANATGLLQTAAGAANSIATEDRNAISAQDPSILAIQAQTAKEKALTDKVTQDQLYQSDVQKGLITP